MKNNKPLLFLLFITLFLQACKTQKNNTITKEINEKAIEIYSFNTSDLLEDVKILSSNAYQGRRTGTKGAKLAEDYIIERFSQLKVKPLNSGYRQSFSFTAGKQYNANNILGLIEGTASNNKYIVLSAHYDHEGVKNGETYNGADDNASGISALFAFAEYLKNNPPKHNVILAAFDGEELGLKGAYHFVNDNVIKQRNIVLNLNMDMISRSDRHELLAVGTRYYPHLKAAIENFKNIGMVDLVIGHEGLDAKDNWTNSSDHAAFHKAKIPFVYFGVADHDDYHKPTDDFEKIDKQFYKDAVETIIQVFIKYDALEL